VRLVIAEKIASDFTLTDIDVVEFSLSDYRGKVVLLNFFQILCGPCVAEIPHLKAVHEEFGEDLIIISISISPGYDTVEKLQQFREEHEIDWIIARDTLGVHENYIITTPTLVIIDQLGYIRYTHSPAPPKYTTAASTLSEEIDYVISRVLIGDVNSDEKIDILDIAIVAKAYGAKEGDPNWNVIADLDDDGMIDILDIATVAKDYGKIQTPFNFLLNSSVEIDENGDNSPEYWDKSDYGDVGAVHTWLDTGHTGNHSVKVSITYNASALGWHSASWWQSFIIQCSPFEIGSSYLFRFWYKSSIKYYIYSGFWDNSGHWIGGQEVECEATTTWAVSQWLEFTVPEGTHRMAVGILMRNGDAEQETNAYTIGDDFELIYG